MWLLLGIPLIYVSETSKQIKSEVEKSEKMGSNAYSSKYILPVFPLTKVNIVNFQK